MHGLIIGLMLMEPCWIRYQKRGFVFGYISHYEGMETGDIVARVVEGRVNKVNVVHVDDEGNPQKAKGEVSPEIILRELPFKVSILGPGGWSSCVWHARPAQAPHSLLGRGWQCRLVGYVNAAASDSYVALSAAWTALQC